MHCYAPNFEEVEGANWFGPVRLSINLPPPPTQKKKKKKKKRFGFLVKKIQLLHPPPPPTQNFYFRFGFLV